MGTREKIVRYTAGILTLSIAIPIFIYSMFIKQGENPRQEERKKGEQVKEGDKISNEEPDGILEKDQVKNAGLQSVLKDTNSNKEALQERYMQCQGEFSIIEIIFLQRENDQIDSKKVSEVYFVEKNRDDCGSYIVHAGNKDPEFFRYRFPVSTDCQCNAFEPGRTYKLISLDEQKDLSYDIRIPKAEQFDFDMTFEKIQNGISDTQVYQFPVFADDVFQMKNIRKRELQKNFEISQKQINVKNIPFRSREHSDAQIIVQYIKSGNVISSKNENNDQCLLTFEWRDDHGSSLGGNIVVYELQEKGKNESGKSRLLACKKNIQSNSVNLASDLDFDGVGEKWISRRMNIDWVTKEKEGITGKKILKTGVPVQLCLRGKGQTAFVSAAKPFMKEGKLYVVLRAPKGKYKLKIGNEQLDRNFKWPPEEE